MKRAAKKQKNTILNKYRPERLMLDAHNQQRKTLFEVRSTNKQCILLHKITFSLRINKVIRNKLFCTHTHTERSQKTYIKTDKNANKTVIKI